MVRSVALIVRDLGSVVRFYEAVIGLAVLEQEPGRAVLGAGGVALLELLHRPEALPRDPAEAGLFHTAFLLPTREDLGRWLAHVAAIGQALDGSADHLVSEAVYLHDPEGNGIEVYADRAPEQWTWFDTPQGPRLKMANARLDLVALARLSPRLWDGAPAGTRIGHVHLQGGDIAAATEFYTRAAGMDVTVAGAEAVFLSFAGYHHHLAVNTWNSRGAGKRDARRAGLESVTLDGAPREIVDPWGTTIRFETTNEESVTA